MCAREPARRSMDGNKTWYQHGVVDDFDRLESRATDAGRRIEEHAPVLVVADLAERFAQLLEMSFGPRVGQFAQDGGAPDAGALVSSKNEIGVQGRNRGLCGNVNKGTSN